MNINSQIKFEFEAIGKIIAFTSVLVNDIRYFQSGLNQTEKIQFGRFTILNRMLNSFKSSLILYLCIIFTDNKDEKLRIKKLINILINKYKSIKWEKALTLNELNKLLTEIERNDDKINQLFIIRDNFIAHIDNTDQRVNLKLDDQEELIRLIQEIHNKLNDALYGASTVWSFPKAEMGHTFLYELDRFSEIRELAFTNLANSKVCIENNELMKIIRKSTSR